VLYIGLIALIVSNPATLFILNKIIASVSILTLIAHLLLIKLNLPINLYDFGGQLFPLVNYDLLPTETVYEYIFGLSAI